MRERLSYMHAENGKKGVQFGPIAAVELKADKKIILDRDVVVPAETTYMTLFTSESIGRHKTTITSLTKSIENLAYYLKRVGPIPSVIYGVTNEHVAKIASRYGFNTKAKTVDIMRKHYLQRDFSNSHMAKRGKEMGRAMICWQSGEEFVKRFAKQENVYVFSFTDEE